jgi:hypothetical protein
MPRFTAWDLITDYNQGQISFERLILQRLRRREHAFRRTTLSDCE